MQITKIGDLAEKLGTRNFKFTILKRIVNEFNSVIYTVEIQSTKGTEAFQININEPKNKRWVTLNPMQGTWYHAKLQRYEDFDTWSFIPLGVMSKQPEYREPEEAIVATPIIYASKKKFFATCYILGGKITLRTSYGLFTDVKIENCTLEEIHGKVIKLKQKDGKLKLLKAVNLMTEPDLCELEKDLEEQFPSNIPEETLDKEEDFWYNSIPESGYLCFDPDTHLVILVFDHTSDKEEFIPLSAQEAIDLTVKPKSDPNDI